MTTKYPALSDEFEVDKYFTPFKNFMTSQGFHLMATFEEAEHPDSYIFLFDDPINKLWPFLNLPKQGLKTVVNGEKTINSTDDSYTVLDVEGVSTMIYVKKKYHVAIICHIMSNVKKGA